MKSKFSCPFHGWTFDNKGSLVGYPKSDHFGKIDKDCYGLTELPCLEKYGFLWVHPKADGKIDLKNLPISCPLILNDISIQNNVKSFFR